MKYTKLLLTLVLMLTACAPVQLETPSSPTPTSAPTSPTSEEVDSLADTQWLLTSFGTPGAETEAMEAAPITLEFSEDGQIMGNGGCNSYTGTYQVEGAVLQVGEVVSTLMACVDEDAMEQEISYFDALQLATSYELADESLTIFYTSPETGEGQLNFARVQDSESTVPAPLAPDESETATPEPEANTGFTPGSTYAPKSGA
jgi:heat shock protein HslJ